MKRENWGQPPVLSLSPMKGNSFMTFSVGETVVYPNHGAAVIEDIETRKSALSPFELHVLSSIDGKRPVEYAFGS